MLKKFKQLFLKAAKKTGAFHVISRSKWRQNRLLILAYHGLAQEDEFLWDAELYVKPEFLRQRFELIKKNNYTVLPLDEAVRLLYAKELPKKSIVITFDDGNYDFYKEALPIVKEFGFPVTVYLTTYYSNDNKPVFDVALSYIIWKSPAGTVWDLADLIDEKGKVELTAEKRQEIRNLIYAKAVEKNFSADRKHEILEKLAISGGVDFAEICRKRMLHLMNPQEVVECAAHNVDFQLHTHRHRVPSDEKLFRREISDNRRALQSLINTTGTHFCYPSGVYETKFIPWLKAENVVSATTCEVAFATPETNPLLLPRLVDTMYLSPIEFEGWLTGISQFLPQRRIPQ